MLYSALAFLAGVCALQLCSDLPALSGWWLGACVALALVPVVWLRVAAAAVGGFLWACWSASQLAGVHLPADLQGRDVRIEGQVQGLPEQLGDGRLRFRFLVEKIAVDQHWQTLQLPVRLSWYRQAAAVQAGERWQLLARLKQPRGFSNPGGFDYERWLFARGIRASGYIRRSDLNRRLTPAARWSVAHLRQQLSSHLQQLQVAPSTRALLRGLGVGDRSGMSAEQWRILQLTGTSHLLAISGLHVGLVAGLAFFVGRKTWSLVGGGQHWPAQRVAALCAVAAALSYALLSGFQVPAQRALIMVSVFMLAIVSGGRTQPWRVWGVALWLVLLVDPLTVLTAGFWLSFGAVALILMLSAGYCGERARWRRLLRVQLGLFVGLTPLLWLWFQQVSLSAPVANLIAIPWVGILVVPLLLAGLLCLPFATPLGDWLLGLSAQLLSVLWWFLEHLAGLPVGLWQTPAVSALWMLLFALGVGGLLLPRALSLVTVSLSLMAAVLQLEAERPAYGEVWFSLLDVGQGLAAVVETQQHLLVYDTGPAFTSGFDTGEAVVVPFLRERGYRQVDRLIISHADKDHIGGARSVLERLKVLSVESGEAASIDWLRASGCQSGRQWLWDGVHFEHLALPATEEGNNSSCVLRVETADGRILLLPGDIEKEVEQRLLRQRLSRLAADVLVAPHHGSSTSSSHAFVRSVNPDYVLFAVGYRNRFGFPRPEVAARYRAVGAELFTTAESGAIQLRIGSAQPLRVVGYRRRTRRYWNTVP